MVIRFCNLFINLKVLQGHKKLDFYKNFYINLALPLFSTCEPIPVKKNKVVFNLKIELL